MEPAAKYDRNKPIQLKNHLRSFKVHLKSYRKSLTKSLIDCLYPIKEYHKNLVTGITSFQFRKSWQTKTVYNKEVKVAFPLLKLAVTWFCIIVLLCALKRLKTIISIYIGKEEEVQSPTVYRFCYLWYVLAYNKVQF